MENGTLASNTKENISVFSMHFHKVLNNHRQVDTTVHNLIQQKPHLHTIDVPITFRELKAAINKLKKGKSLGLNGIPPEALKAMNDTPRRIVHKHVSDYFEGKADHEGWHKSQCIPVPKKGEAKHHADGHVQQSLQLGPQHSSFSPTQETQHPILIWRNTQCGV